VKTAVALVSARAARGLDEDMPPLLAAFAAAGAHAEIADWDDPEADWARFDAALLRSAWDYTERLPEFLDWIARVDAITTLLNPAPVLRWSADKHYCATSSASACRWSRPPLSSPVPMPGRRSASSSSARCAPSWW